MILTYTWRTDPTHTRERGYVFPANSDIDRATAWMLNNTPDLLDDETLTPDELQWLRNRQQKRLRKTNPSITRNLPQEAARCFRQLEGNCAMTGKCKHEPLCNALKEQLQSPDQDQKKAGDG